MNFKKLTQTIALLVSVTIIFASCALPEIYLPFELPFSEPSPGSGNSASIEQRHIVPYEEMEYTRPDMESIKISLATYTEKTKHVRSFEELQQLDSDISDLVEPYFTMLSLAQLKTYQNIHDTYFEEEYRYLEEYSSEISSLINHYTHNIVNGAYAENYKQWVGEYYYQSLVNSLQLDSDNAIELKKQRKLLSIDYNNMLTTMSVSYAGNTYTMDSIMALEDEALREELYVLLLAENSPKFADIYRQTIDIDNKTAELLGFDSAADMYYLAANRDYTPEQAMEYVQTIKTIFTPLASDIFSKDRGYLPATMENTLPSIPGALEKINPQLEHIWNTMQEYHLYDFTNNNSKHKDVGFTTYLNGFDAPFCFGTWDGSFSSATTSIHEFGHFTDNWLRYDMNAVQNIDIAEIYSQGLEVLMQPYYGDLAKSKRTGSFAIDNSLNNLFSALLMQSFLEEFQQIIYTTENLTNEDIISTFDTLSQEYGLAEYLGGDMAYRWLTINHLFDSPFYTISYVTSGVVALQLWDISQTDHAKAASIYMDMITADQNRPFTELVTTAGLKSPFDNETLYTIQEELKTHFKIKDVPLAA